MASVRAKETAELYSHKRPNGTIWSTILDENHLYTFGSGENILETYNIYNDIPKEAMEGWMNSEGHRANILNEDFKNIGVGVAYVNGCYYCVQNFTRDLIKWDVSDNVLTVTGDGDITISVPEQRPWSAYNETITGISLGSGITNIGSMALSYMPSLASIVLPETIKEVGSSAFYDCKALQEITFMNPECRIDENTLTIPYNTVICGYENSTAQAYAEKNGRTFKSLGEVPVVTLGNVNEDTVIDAVDASLVLSEYAELSVGNPFTFTDTQQKAADVNNDGKIDAVDASLISGYYAEVSTGSTVSFEEFLGNNL